MSSADPPTSPVLISLADGQYELSSRADPVFFDLDADGSPERVTGTARGSDEAFLAVRRAAAGRLHRPLAEIAASLVHVQVNRWLRDAPVRHEAVIYDFLARLHASRRARSRAEAEAAAEVG